MPIEEKHQLIDDEATFKYYDTLLQNLITGGVK